MPQAESLIGADRYAARVLRDGPFGYWRLTEASGTVAADSSGNGRVGTVSGTGTFGSAGALADGSTALALPGDASVVTIPTGAPDSTLAACTFEAWVKTNTLTVPSVVRGILAGANAGVTAFLRLTLQAGGVFEVRVNPGGVQISAYAAATAVVGQWCHLAAVWTGTSLVLYCNGLAGVPVAGGGALTVGAMGWLIGVYTLGTANRSWDGVIGDVALYPRALSALEVATHYSLRLATGRDGLLAGGTAAVGQRSLYAGQGGARMGGTSPITRGARLTPAGGVWVAGAGALRRSVAIVGSGGVALSGRVALVTHYAAQFTVTGSPVVPFVDAVKAALVADVALMGLITGVYGGTSRADPTVLPYVQLGRRAAMGDGFAMQKAGADVSLQIDVWSEKNGAYEASRIAGEVRRVLARTPLVLVGFTLILGSVTCEMEEVFEEPDADMPDRALYHAVQRWQASLEEMTA